jgi:hypothetical protein
MSSADDREAFQAWRRRAKHLARPETPAEAALIELLYGAFVGGRRSATPAADVPLTTEQMHEILGTAGPDLLALAKDWADNKLHTYQFTHRAECIVGAVLVRAGIKR